MNQSQIYSYLKHISTLLLLLVSYAGNASHIYGIDMYYKHFSGNTYTIYIAVYGDCSGSAFNTLTSASPVVTVYDGATSISTLHLNLGAPTDGVEVTPVCPSQAGNTTCTNLSHPLPGIKKFVYSTNITLPYRSANWRFVFSSVMGSSTAGRSNSITNINFTSTGSPIQLVDSLNNTSTDNSSPEYTSIPTPFYCIGIPANFNPGTVDPDGDVLSFYLVPGIESSTGRSVNYVWPYNATNPVSATTGTFTFSNTTGQLSFTPNISQRSLVVYNVRETTSSGVLKGTSQREMTMVVLSTCSNTAPIGSITGASAGSIVSGTQFNICNTTDSFHFNINPTDAEGDTISMSVLGLPTGANFTITGNNTRRPTAVFNWRTSGIAPGSYTFYINFNDNGCPLAGRQTIAYTVTILPSPSQSLTLLSQPTCTRNGLYRITPSGLGSPFTILALVGSATVRTFTGVTGAITDSLPTGTYTIRISNTSGCSRDTTLRFVAPSTPNCTVALTRPSCAGTTDGAITITATTGTSPFVYALGTGSYGSSGSFTGLPAGVYSLHVKDANNCIKDTTVTLPDPAPIFVHSYIRRPLCDTQRNGRIILAGYNSIGPYQYAIGSGSYSTNDTFNNLNAGTYTFHVKNALGCIKDTIVYLTDSLRLSISITSSSILCYGGTTTYTFGGVSGYGPYRFAVDGGSLVSTTSFDINAGRHAIHLRDTQNCFFDTTIILNQPDSILARYLVNNVTCFGGNNGQIVVLADGGTPGFRYSVDSTGFTLSDTLRALTAGDHLVEVMDANGCIFRDTIAITQPTQMLFDSIVAVLPSCHGLSNGTISIFAHGGTPSYLFATGSGSYVSSSVFTGLASGTYILHVRDVRGCPLDSTYILNEPARLFATCTVVQPLCNSFNDGSVQFTAVGGTASYQYAMGSGSYNTTGSFTGLPAGTYAFHVKDANNCTFDTIITINNRYTISATFAFTEPLCPGGNNGSFVVIGAGGVTPYTYALGSGSFSSLNNFTGLSSANYLVHIRDSNNCQLDTLYHLSEPLPLLIATAITRPSCWGLSDGTIAVAGFGGTSPYQFSLNHGSYSSSISFAGQAAGFDTISIKDNHGCIYDTVVEVTQPQKLIVSGIRGFDVLCNGNHDGKILIRGSGGTTPYRYSTDSGPLQTNDTLQGLASGLHTIRITDNNGCTVDTNFTLHQPTPIYMAQAGIKTPTCEGFHDGVITLFASGGVMPYKYSNDSLSFSYNPTFTGLGEGTYTFFVTDGNGCTKDTTITLVGYPHIHIDSFNTTLLCHGDTDGSLTIHATGGVQPLKYSIGDTAFVSGNTFGPVNFGKFLIEVRDSKNCKKDSLFDLTEPDKLELNSTITPNDCTGPENSGLIIMHPTGGTLPYSYFWVSDSSTKPFLMAMPNGDYTVKVWDNHNCHDSSTFHIGFNDCCTPFIPNAFTPNDDGRNDNFKLKYRGDTRIIEFSIYNRFGECVYKREYSEEGWDGKYKGQLADVGTYYYFIRLICGNLGDKILEFSGDVTLIR